MNDYKCLANLTRDPETHTFQSGATVTKFGIAVNNRRKNAQTGKYESEPCFLDVEAWEGVGKIIQDNYQKGDPILMDGSLRMETWEDKNTGAKRSKTTVRLNNLHFLPGGKKNQNEDSQPQAAAPTNKAAGKSGGRGRRAAAPTPAPEVEQEIGDENTIPF